MPLYVYRHADGLEIERLMPMATTHPDAIVVDRNGEEKLIFDSVEPVTVAVNATFDEESGREYRRVFGNNFLDDGRHRTYPYASVRLAGKIKPEDAEHKDAVVRGIPHEQLPIIRSPQHEQEIAKKYNLVRE